VVATARFHQSLSNYFNSFSLFTGELIKYMNFFFLVASHIFCLIFKTKKYEICRKTPELLFGIYIHTHRQRDMVFIFLFMGLIASPFGLAMIASTLRISPLDFP
jgi:hypothetical protein